MAEPVIIKKYANRRLYNTETSTYITLTDLANILRAGRDVEVVDAKTATDLTRQTLAQVILEEDGKGAAMLPASFMKQLISFYDNSLQTVIPHYLDMVMDVFNKNQSRIREETDRALGGMNMGGMSQFSPFAQLQAMQNLQRQQIAQIQQVMGMFNPFLRGGFGMGTPQNAREKEARIRELEDELARLRSSR